MQRGPQPGRVAGLPALMLSVQALKARYRPSDPPVIEGLSFTLPDGGSLALLGPSGCGKTTLLHLLCGVLTPEHGELRFDGEPLTPKKVPIGLVPQGYGLLPWKTVRENCLFAARLRGGEDAAALDSLAARLGLTALLRRYPPELSGGQAQRVALARALLMRPRLLLLDEPFSALDIGTAAEARTLCHSLWQESGATLVLATHQIEEALCFARRIAVMGPGGRFLALHENPEAGADDLRRRVLAAKIGEELRAARAGEAAG